MRKLSVLVLVPLCILTACGGGGGGYGGGGTPPPPPPPANIEPIVVDAGPVNNANVAYVSVTLCVPGTTTCQTIDHIEVDTGSSGLRVISSLLTIPLPFTTKGGAVLAECMQFADGSSFGPLATADVTLPVSGKQVASLPVQVIGESGYTVPGDCPPKAENTVSTFLSNGVLGVGLFLQDCGPACVTTLQPGPNMSGVYYTCVTPGSCTNSTATLAEQVPNPVSLFASDNNGVILELPSVGITGATTVSGSLIFGIGTQSNNGLGTATVLLADPNSGDIRATYQGTLYTHGHLDSGSNANFFNDATIHTCSSTSKAPGFYCPLATLDLMATLQGTDGASKVATFSVVNADAALTNNPTAAAMPGFGAPNGDPMGFDLGLPFYFGRSVYTAIEGQSTPGGVGPYFAF